MPLTFTLKAARYALAALATTCALTLHAAPAPATPTASVDHELSDYQHTRWTQENGAPPRITGMAQTPDGWLWLATDDGLFRFDGMSFERYAPAALGAFGRRRILGMRAHPNGNLYLYYVQQDIAILHADGRFEVMPRAQPPWGAGIRVSSIDADGSMWVIGDAVHHFAGGRWTTVDRNPAWATTTLLSATLDPDGRLWVTNDEGAWRLDRARMRFEHVSPQKGAATIAPSGDVWLLDQQGKATWLAPSAGKTRPPSFNAFESSIGLFDTSGALWSLNCPNLVCVAHGAAARGGSVDMRRDADAWSGNPAAPASHAASTIIQDREQNIWVVTENSLDRFRPKRFLATGLDRAGDVYSLAADASGVAWVANRSDGSLWQLRPGQPAQRMPWEPVSVLAKGFDGGLLLGGARTIWRRARDRVDAMPLPPGPNGRPFDHHVMGILDDGKVVWVVTAETGLIAWNGGHWLPQSAITLPQQIYQAAGAGLGQLLLWTAQGEFVFYDNGKQTHYDGSVVGGALGLFGGADITVGGDRGFAVLKDGRLQLLHAADPDILRGISGVAVTADGDRWLNGAAGVLHVRAADWKRAIAHPATPLVVESFGPADGDPGRASVASRLPTAITPDGRYLWFLGTGGVTGLDSADLRRNRIALDPTVLSVATDNAVFTPASTSTSQRAVLHLPPGANNFRVDFTAPALRQPEQVRFQYMLDGVDAHWQDAGTRRSTAYTNVGPGAYVFRVRAANEDGAPGRADVALPLAIAPTLVQSLPFKIACAVALLALATLLYRLRVRVLTRRLTERVTERLQVKLDERERIARTLHDTILQTVQALVLRLDALASSLPAGERTRHALETMLRDAGHAIGEGRDQVRELRTAAAPALEQNVHAWLAELQALHPGIACDVRTVGAARPLRPAMAEEAQQIVREALRNAFTHARARRIDVGIEHGRRALVLTVRDDGCGLDAEVARTGYRSGHWGLIGMRERASRIAARLDIAANGAAGTLVTLTVPAARAYAV